jgi:hypothetical protein
MLIVSSRAIALLKDAKRAEGASSNAGIRIRHNNLDDPKVVKRSVSDLQSVKNRCRAMSRSNRTAFAFLWKIG